MVDSRIAQDKKVCTKCGVLKPIRDFSLKDGRWRSNKCKDCVNAEDREWRANHPEETAIRRKRAYKVWREKHPKLPPLPPLNSPEGRLCRSCNTRKPAEEFGLNKSSKDGRAWRCKDCARVDMARWRAANAEHVRDYGRYRTRKRRAAMTAQQRDELDRTNRRRRAHGVTAEEFLKMVKNQDQKCLICETPMMLKASNERGDKRTFLACVDHDHSTGKIRGILCNRCNRAVGMFGDDVNLMKKAIKYLMDSRNV